MQEDETTVEDLFVDSIDSEESTGDNQFTDVTNGVLDTGDTSGGDDDDGNSDAASNTQTGGESGTADTGDEDGADDNPSSGIERLLADHGVEGGVIVFEDGEKVHINDLSDEEQYNVLHSIISGSRPSIEKEFDLNDDEIALLNMVRESGGSVEDVLTDLVNGQVNKALSTSTAENVDWDAVLDDDIYMTFLKTISGDKSEQELIDDLEKAKEISTYKEIVASKREEFKGIQETKVESDNAKISEDVQTQLDSDRRTIVSTVSTIKDVAGFGITDAVKNELLEDMLEVDEQGNAKLIGKIFSDPATILKAAWFLKYGESSIDQMEKYYRQELTKAHSRGKAEAFGRLPSAPNTDTFSGVRNTLSTKRELNTPTNDVMDIEDLYPE